MGKKIQLNEALARKLCHLLKNYYYLANQHHSDVDNCPEEMNDILSVRDIIRHKILASGKLEG